MKLLCKLFGHKYPIIDKYYCGYCLCSRCTSQESSIYWEHFNRSDLDESENVFGEE
ncbi:DUF1660 family phage protein [Lactococcus lactis]|uniref:DUF1660 family phage protein n=1 Tax=Lactococcus lactis TaxID=1358 RepID=UPI0009C10B57|nr:DUF1660 family phage protein [Lactococcus lactis]